MGIPFIGINSGGIGEIGRLTGADKLLASDDSTLAESLSSLLIYVNGHYKEACDIMQKARDKAVSIFSVEQYVSGFERIISE